MRIGPCQTEEVIYGLLRLTLAIKMCLEVQFWFQCTLQMHSDPILKQDQGKVIFCSSLVSTRVIKMVAPPGEVPELFGCPGWRLCRSTQPTAYIVM